MTSAESPRIRLCSPEETTCPGCPRCESEALQPIPFDTLARIEMVMMLLPSERSEPRALERVHLLRELWKDWRDPLLGVRKNVVLKEFQREVEEAIASRGSLNVLDVKKEARSVRAKVDHYYSGQPAEGRTRGIAGTSPQIRTKVRWAPYDLAWFSAMWETMAEVFTDPLWTPSELAAAVKRNLRDAYEDALMPGMARAGRQMRRLDSEARVDVPRTRLESPGIGGRWAGWWWQSYEPFRPETLRGPKPHNRPSDLDASRPFHSGGVHPFAHTEQFEQQYDKNGLNWPGEAKYARRRLAWGDQISLDEVHEGRHSEYTLHDVVSDQWSPSLTVEDAALQNIEREERRTEAADILGQLSTGELLLLRRFAERRDGGGRPLDANERRQGERLRRRLSTLPGFTDFLLDRRHETSKSVGYGVGKEISNMTTTERAELNEYTERLESSLGDAMQTVEDMKLRFSDYPQVIEAADRFLARREAG